MKKYSTKQKLALTMAVGLLATSAPALSFANTTVQAGLKEISGGPGGPGIVSYNNLRKAGDLIKKARATNLPADIAAAQAAVNELNLQNHYNVREYNRIMATIGGQVVAPVVGENELTGVIETGIFGDALVITIKPEITAIASITVNGVAKQAGVDFGSIEEGKVRVFGVKAGDIVVLTAGTKAYTVKF